MANLVQSTIGRLKTVAAKLLLRGGWLRLWIRWRTDKLVTLYKKMLVRTSRVEAPPRPNGTPAPAGATLNKLLFITDAVWERRELVPELSLICDVTLVDVHPLIVPDSGASRERLPFERIMAELVPYHKTAFDCVLVYLRGTLLSTELTDFLRSNWRCPLIGLNLDCKTTFEDYGVFRREPEGYCHWAGAFDCNLTNAKAMVDVYNARGFHCLYLPTGYHYNPAIHQLQDAAAFEHGISFVGSCKPDRKWVVEHLREIGIDVRVFGGGWDGQPFVQDAWRIYQKSQLNLGIGYNVADTRITNLKNRDFECPGTGACYLTTYDWELAGLFDIGKEILCYRSMDDLAELYSYYIRRPEECRRIAAAGYERCRREHTWEQRFRKVFVELGFTPGKPPVERHDGSQKSGTP